MSQQHRIVCWSLKYLVYRSIDAVSEYVDDIHLDTITRYEPFIFISQIFIQHAHWPFTQHRCACLSIHTCSTNRWWIHRSYISRWSVFIFIPRSVSQRNTVLLSVSPASSARYPNIRTDFVDQYSSLIIAVVISFVYRPRHRSGAHDKHERNISVTWGPCMVVSMPRPIKLFRRRGTTFIIQYSSRIICFSLLMLVSWLTCCSPWVGWCLSFGFGRTTIQTRNCTS